MKIYSPNVSTPAAAITLATGNCNTQPILFTNHFGDTGTYEGCDGSKAQEVKLNWVIKDIEVSLTRDWGTSTAFIILACELPDRSMFLPPLPDVSFYRKGDYPYLCEEDEIRIYAGYVNSTTTPITADLLDELPFDYIDIETNTQKKHNRSKPLAPIFWGFIDKIEYLGSPTEEKLVLSCRDRTRVFADTRIVSLQAFQGKTNGQVQASAQGVVEASSELTGIASGDRVNLLLELANAAAGNPFGGRDKTAITCWKAINEGMIVRGYTYDPNTKENAISFPQQDPSQWVQTATCKLMGDNAEPRMNVWAERPPIIKGEAKSIMQVLNKTPLEVIDFLAKTEQRPMDFFASHINGDYVLGPRVKDESGFDDPERQYRTYFYRTYPKVENPPTLNSMIIRIRATRSTLFSFNNFIIIDSTNKSRDMSLLQSVRRGYTALPTHLTNREPTPPCKTQIIYDGGLASYQNPEQGALLLGLAHARIWSRDIQGVEMEVIGDPTLYPSESVRIYNTYLHDYKSYTMVDSKLDEQVYTQIKRNESLKTAQETSDLTPDQAIDTSPDNATSKFMAKYLNGPSRIPSDIKNLVLPYYSIRAVKHKLTTQGDRGYTTTVLCVSDI